MKILVLAQSAGLGGVESSLTNFIRYIAEKGHDVTVVFWRDTGPVRDSLPSSVRVIDIQTGCAGSLYRTGGLQEALGRERLSDKAAAMGYIGLRRLLRYLRNPWILLQRISEHFDIGIAYRHQGYGPYYLIDCVKATKKIMWYHHGAYEPSPMGYAVDRAYFDKMDSVVAVAESARSMLVERFPALQGRIQVIHNIIDERAIRQKALAPTEGNASPTGLTIVTVSRLSREKGVDLAVRTARVLQDRGLDFAWNVIGDGPERARIEDLIAQLGVEQRFMLMGGRPNPFPYMRQADLYVQTSRVEAHPLTIQEAMVLGKPIVASFIPSIASVLEHGRLGSLSELTPEAFAQSIEALASNKDARTALAERLAQYEAPNEVVFSEIDRLLAG